AFQVTVDVPEIYIQEFWATAKLHHNSIRFKIDTRKSVLDLEAFREIHSHDIRYLTDVNVNKLYQPWRSFASVINKCLTGKSSGVDSFRLSQAQMLWGFYHRINIDFAYLIWEDFVYQITQQYGAILPIELTTNEIRNSKAYKEYHACAMGEAAPKPKASARKKKGDTASSTTPPTPTPTTTVESAPRLFATAKGKQPSRATTPTEPIDVQRTEAEQLKIILKRSRQETHISQQSGSGTNEGTGSNPGVSDVPSDDSEEELSWKSSDDEDVGSHKEGNKSNESDDDRDEGSDDDSKETVKAGAGKDDDDDDDEDDDDNDEEEELAKSDEEDKESGKGGDEVRESEGESDEEETRLEEEESFYPIPRTPEKSKEESNEEEDQDLRLKEKEAGKGGDEVRESEGKSDEEETRLEEEESFDPIPRTLEKSEEESNEEEDQDLQLSEEARIQEEEDADELYRDVNINQGRGLQVTQNVEDTHVTLTPVNPDGPQESSSMSSFVSSMLNPISDVGVESIFMTTSSLIVSLQSETPIMTPFTIATI
nr:hypothetical protein [Tanacetum cinerariifolium]